ncbi:TPA: hypothetical protein I3316_000252 [Enterobacter hormaechei subsp. xiangfangensis]|nr:hypothetical protein [Enterobacter hormaechei subsp. xiangfangensis]
MSTLTKEWLLKTIAELEEERDATPGAVNEDAAMALAAMKLALASLEAEAVGEVVLGEYDDCGCHPDAKVVCIAADGQADWENFKDGTRLYTAPPAPEFYKIGDATMRHIFTPTGITDVSDMQAVFDQIETVLAGMWQPAPASVPDEITSANAPEVFEIAAEAERLGLRGAYASYAVGWNACRAAMLQGAEPVTTVYKLPDDFDFDRFNDVVWLEAVASNPHMHSPTTSTIAMVALELNRKLANGNSPVIPDGWALVPIDPTEDMIVNGFESEPDESFSDEKEWEAYDAMSGCQQAAHRARLCWSAMIASRPKLKHDLT